MPRPDAPTIRFRNPVVSLENEPMIVIDQSAKSCDVRRTVSDTYDANTITFNDVSSKGTSNIIDRKMFIDYEYHISLSAGGTPLAVLSAAAGITAASDTTVSFNRGADGAADFGILPGVLNKILDLVGVNGPEKTVGPRCLGLNQSCTNLTLTINGSTVSTKPETYINAVEWYNSHSLNSEHEDYSMCASYQIGRAHV